MNHDVEWWKRRAERRYAELRKAEAKLMAIQSALDAHADCWPDDPCLELAHDIREALGGAA